MTYSLNEGLIETHTCATCAVLICLPKGLANLRREDGLSFYCPNGHVLTFTDNEAARLRKQLNQQIRRAEAIATEKYNVEREVKSLKRALKKAQAK